MKLRKQASKLLKLLIRLENLKKVNKRPLLILATKYEIYHEFHKLEESINNTL